ncbi:paraquat-inducible protein A [Uliginosibacterium gangwonense]|uniref:paraquat-inducible protein A n=1 Tax=Uliginosibacterium gangwonense TaxID=392736 RepID=UPI00036911C3|nr:PqiA/YebS family transporter subunit [Uliginosibacterium gangwonense]
MTAPLMPLVACDHCNLIHRPVAALPHGQFARCTRCGSRLHGAHVHSLDRALALALAAAILFLCVCTFPLMHLDLQGMQARTALPGAMMALYRQNMSALALLTGWAALVAPAAVIASMLYILLPMRMGRVPPGFARVMRGMQFLQSWAMVEVFMLGVVVSLVKLGKVGEVHADVGTGLCAALMLLLTGLSVEFEHRRIWQMHDILRFGRMRDQLSSSQSAAQPDQPLLVCSTCGLICTAHGEHCACPRCNTMLHAGRPQSLSRCLALLLASLLLYFPANLLTMMETTSAFDVQEDTIISGVVYLWQNGSPDLAVIVFVASVVVPLLKILCLGLLLACVKWRWQIPRIQQSRLFALVEFVGKWSMLDLFVIALLSALVDFGPLASVRAGPAAIAFGAVVVLTMLAASAFDPHLIWREPIKKTEGSNG